LTHNFRSSPLSFPFGKEPKLNNKVENQLVEDQKYLEFPKVINRREII